MEPSTDILGHLPLSLRRDTISTISSDKQPSLPSGQWPLEIHGNCTRCGHHHQAAVIQINVMEGFCEASHVICERCHQKWLTIGGLNSTQISLLSTITTDLDYGEVNFRYTLVRMMKSVASIASPTALANVPEDPPRTSSRGSSIRPVRRALEQLTNSGSRDISPHRAGSGSARVPGIEVKPELPSNKVERGQGTYAKPRRFNGPTFKSIKQKLKDTVGVFRKVNMKGIIRRFNESTATKEAEGKALEPRRSGPQELLSSPVPVEKREPCFDDVRICNGPTKTATEAIEDLKSFDKEIIRNMTLAQRKDWVRRQITMFKCRCRRRCRCKRRQSGSSVTDHGSIRSPDYRLSPTFPASPRFSLSQMGSQFDTLPDALFTHTGPLTISATRISEARTAVEDAASSSSPRNSGQDLAQHAHRSRSPRPASLAHFRRSRQHLIIDRGQRDSVDSVLAGSTVGNS